MVAELVNESVYGFIKPSLVGRGLESRRRQRIIQLFNYTSILNVDVTRPAKEMNETSIWYMCDLE